jgi:peptidoglycan/xylan/chitin deacetylase (PgdA/CDA1 family)
MIASLKQAARAVAAASGCFDIARWLTASSPRILMYHNFRGPDETCDGAIGADIFRWQMTYVARHFRPLSLSDLIRRLERGDSLPDRAVVVTVDDGYASFLRWALPVLRQVEIPATLFVVSDLVESGEWLYADRLRYVCDRMARDADYATTVAAIDSFKHLPPAGGEQRLTELAQTARVTVPAMAPEAFRLLSWSELQEVVRSGLVEIGSHSRRHAILSSVDDERARLEIEGSRCELQQRLEIEVSSFCYPNGLPGDYRPEHMAMVRDAGYRCATAAHFGCVTPSSDRFALPRVGGVDDPSLFRKYVDGFELLQRRVRREAYW